MACNAIRRAASRAQTRLRGCVRDRPSGKAPAGARRFGALFLLAALAPPALGAGPAFAQPAASVDETSVETPRLNETREEKLERLHAALVAAPDGDGARIAQEIQSLWSRSGSASMDLLLSRGRDAMEKEDYVSARAHLAAVTRLAPDFAEGWNALATLHYLQKDFGRAVDVIERVLALEPRHFSALTGLALSLEQTGRKASALTAWRAVEALYPSFENARSSIERLAPEVDGEAL